MSKPESIVYIDKAAAFYELPAHATGVIRMDVEAAFKRLDLHTGQKARELLENDPYNVHPITYDTIAKLVDNTADSKIAVLVYDRPAKNNGEMRLAGLSSVGIGGHVEHPDVARGAQGQIDLFATVTSAGLRELQEEVKLSHPPVSLPIEALIFDPSNEVGKVHLGVWGLAWVSSESEIIDSEDQLLNARWELLEDIDTSKFENWSKMVIEQMQSLYLPKKAGDHDGDMYEDGHDRLRALAEQ